MKTDLFDRTIHAETSRLADDLRAIAEDLSKAQPASRQEALGLLISLDTRAYQAWQKIQALKTLFTA